MRLSSDGSVLLQDDPPGVEFTRRGGLSPVVRVELPVVGQNPGQVDQSLHPFVTWISNFRDVVLYKCVYLSWSIVSYLKQNGQGHRPVHVFRCVFCVSIFCVVMHHMQLNGEEFAVHGVFGAVLKVIAKVKVDLIKDVDVFLVVGHSVQHAQFLVGVERTGMAIIDKRAAGPDVLQVIMDGVAHFTENTLCVNVYRRLSSGSAFLPQIVPHNRTPHGVRVVVKL